MNTYAPDQVRDFLTRNIRSHRIVKELDFLNTKPNYIEMISFFHEGGSKETVGSNKALHDNKLAMFWAVRALTVWKLGLMNPRDIIKSPPSGFPIEDTWDLDMFHTFAVPAEYWNLMHSIHLIT
jgi:hypothetical protein